MQYKFDKAGEPGVLDIKNYQVAWYDMENNGKCFDEDFFDPDEIGDVIAYVETEDEKNNLIRSKVFVNFNNGDIYEIKLVKIKKGDNYG